MAITNKLLPQVDLPVWEWMRFTPTGVITNALTALTTARDGSSRYLFYYENTNNALWKYDTQADSWYQLSNSGVSSTTLVTPQYVKNQGYRGNILSVPSSTQLQIPSVGGPDLSGYQIKIISGTGAGQTKTITATATEIIHDWGLVTTATTSTLTDSTKKYKHNQWVGYAARLTFGTGINQFREILYNDPTSITVYDANYEGRNFSTVAYSSATPYAVPATTAGSQTVFEIVSQVITVDSPWTITPDATSKFMIMSGGIWFLTGGTPFIWYYYDILSDRWVQKLAPSTGIGTAALSTDADIEPTNDLTGYYFSASFISGTSQSIDTASLTPGDWIGSVVRIISGSGSGQERRIVSNTSSSLVLSSKWDTMPISGSSVYAVTAENAIYLEGSGNARLMKYYPEPSLWSQSNIIDDGIVFNFVALRTDKRQSQGINAGSRGTNGVTSVNPIPTAAGSGYAVGDLLTISGGSGTARVYVESVSALGAVLSISLYQAGNGYSTGPGKATTGGTGTGCTVEILTLGTICQFTTSINHDFKLGDTFTLAGATEAAYNTTYTVIGMPGSNGIEVITTATTNPTAIYQINAYIIADLTKNWIPGEHCGKLLGFQANGITGAITWRKIVGNTTNTITSIFGTSPTNGSSRYFIAELEAFGDDKQYLADTELNYGYPTSATTSSITDVSKNWTFQATASTFYNYKVQLLNNSGSYVENIIVGNTSSSLSLGRTVAIGAGTNTIAYSDLQGSSSVWTGLGSTAFGIQGNGIVWNGSKFVGVGSGSGGTICWSNDGAAWNNIASVFSTQGNGIAWNGIRFLAVGSGTTNVAHSPDGITWTNLGAVSPLPTTQGNGVSWNGTRWIIVGQGTNTISYAMDTGSFVQASFTGLGTSMFSQTGKGVCWAGTQFIAVGSGSNTFATSSDGVTWGGGGTTAFGTNGTGNGVCWNGSTAVMVGSGSAPIYYSTNNGTSWTSVGAPQIQIGYNVCWNGTYFVAVGSGSGTHIAYSPDGIAWTGSGTGGFTTAVYGVASSSPFSSVVPSIGLVPDTNTRYKIQDSYGTMTAGTLNTITDASKRWKVNQWAGKRVVVTSGTGQIQEVSITSNTVNTLTLAQSITTPDNTSTYTILGRAATGAGTTIQWNWGTTNTSDKGKLLIVNKGNSTHTWDIFDLRTNRWRPLPFVNGAREQLTTGTMYAYDGIDRIYFHVNATGRINYYDIKKNKIEALGQVPYGMGSAVLSNRMEIISTADGLQYMYIMRHSGTEMWRTLIYY